MTKEEFERKIIFNELITKFLKSPSTKLNLTSYEKYNEEILRKKLLEFKTNIGKTLPKVENIALETTKRKRTEVTMEFLKLLFKDFEEYTVLDFQVAGNLDVFKILLSSKEKEIYRYLIFENESTLHISLSEEDYKNSEVKETEPPKKRGPKPKIKDFTVDENTVNKTKGKVKNGK